MVPGEYYLILSAALFVIGAAGVLLRRNPLVVFMSVEMMLNAVNLTLVTYARVWDDVAGRVFALVIMAVAAAEVAVGLAIIVALARGYSGTPDHGVATDVDEANLLKG